MSLGLSVRRANLALAWLLIMMFGLQVAPGLLAPAPAAAAQAIPDTDVVPYGVNTFLDKEVEFWKKERTIQLVSDAGIKWIKQLFAWNEIEFKKGYFTDDKNKKPGWQKFDEIVDLAAKYKIGVVARIDQTPAWANPAGGKPGGRPANNQDYADFLKEFVKHYSGKVKYIQVWNEPNLEREWIPGQRVNPKEYVDMLKQAYRAIKEADPSVRVMAAPLAITTETIEQRGNLNELAYLDQMYKAGAKEFFDILPANAYGLEFAPEANPDPKVLNFRRVELLRKVMVDNGDASKGVWFNEYGWNASPASIPADQLTWRRVSEQQQAEYTVRGIQYAKKNWPWVGVVFVWFFRQVGDIPDNRSEQYFQLVTKDFTPKPVYNALRQDALSYLQQRNIPTPVPATPAAIATSTPVPGGTAPANSPAPTAARTNPTATVIAAVPGITPTAAPLGAVPIPAATVTPSGRPGVNPSPAQPQESSNLILFVIGGLIILGAGGGLAYWLTQQRRA